MIFLNRSLWGTAVRILLASADSSILTRWPNSMSLLFCMVVVRGGCSVRRRTSLQLETRWYQRISRILLRHHRSDPVHQPLASAFDRAQHSDPLLHYWQNADVVQLQLGTQGEPWFPNAIVRYLHRTASEATATVNVVATEN